MLQHAHQHAFTSFPHQTFASGISATPTGMQDSDVSRSTAFNTHLPRGLTRPSFAPVTALHSTTHKSFSFTKQGRWGALHVGIAWKIYYKERLKKMQQTPSDPAISLPDRVKSKEFDLSSCRPSNPDPPCEHLTSRPSDLHTSSSVSYHSSVSQRKELDQHLTWKEKLDEKEKHRSQQINKTKDLPLKDKSLDQAAELDGRLCSSADRKRQLECNSSLEMKKAKQVAVGNHCDSSQTKPSEHVSDFSVVYPHSKRCNVTRAQCGRPTYPGTELHPYQTMWDYNKWMELYCGQSSLKNTFKTCKVIRISPAAQTPGEAPRGYSSAPLHFPLALREQENIYLRERESLHSQQQNCHFHCCRYQLPYHCFLQTPHLMH